MKKIILALGIFLVLVVAALAVIPVFFKDDIQAVIDRELDKTLKAEIMYDTDAFGISLLSSFPDLGVTMGNFGIVGVDDFEGDTLVFVSEFQVKVDLMSVITGDEISISNVTLNNPLIRLLVLDDGSANYDIMIDFSNKYKYLNILI